jgi:MFS family permease
MAERPSTGNSRGTDALSANVKEALTDAPTRVTPWSMVALILGQLGVHSAMAGTRMAAPLEALRQGHGALAAGVLLALFALAPVALALPAGRLADRHGYHRPMHIAVALTVLGALVAALSSYAGPWLEQVWALPSDSVHGAGLIVAAILCGTGANTGVLATQRMVARQTSNNVERVRVFSWLGMAPAMANAVGPVVAGLTIDAAGFGAAYAVMAALALTSLIFVARMAPAAGQRAPRDRNLRAWSLLREPSFKRLLFVNWLVSSSWDVHSFAVPLMGHERGFSATTIGLILGAFTLSVTVVRFVIPSIATRLDPVRVLSASMLGTALVFAAYPWMPGPWSMAACAIVLGVFLGAVQPMILTTLMVLTPEARQGEALALRSMTINASSAVMPVAFGFVGAVVGTSLLFWVMGAAVGAGHWAARRLG